MQTNINESWNFHGHIAVHLEMDARLFYGKNNRQYGATYDADSIEGGTFARIMITLLEKKYSNSNDSTVDAFINKCQDYIGLPASEIENETAQSLYNEFHELFIR